MTAATFTGAPEIAHVIGRVTGGTPSEIDGLLRSEVGAADLWLLNPAGIVFGPNAELDLPGAFHAGTGGELRFDDGTSLPATGAVAVLSTAAPASFGFLGPVPAGPLRLDGAALEMLDAGSITLAGGDVTLTEATISAERGSVVVRGGRFVMVDGEIETATEDDTWAGPIRIEVARLDLEGESSVASLTEGDGQGGEVSIDAEMLRLSGENLINVTSIGPGTADDIVIRATAIKLVEEAEIIGEGTGGTILIRGKSLDIADDSEIASEVDEGAGGDAGSVVIEVARLSLRGEPEIST